MVSLSVLPQLTTNHPLVQSLAHSRVSLLRESSCTKLDQLNKSEPHFSLPQAQDLICQFFLEELKQCPPESILQQFKHIFIEPTKADNSTLYQALYLIVSSGSEENFIYTLKRTIYILVNNWTSQRQQKYIQQLLELLSTSLNTQEKCPTLLKRLTLWRRNFVSSQDYQELKLFASKYENRRQEHWSQRYSSYLLVSQAVDVKKPLEQQEAARAYSKQLKEQFKLELAMYTARSSSTACQNRTAANPTSLGDQVLGLIQKILKNRSRFSYASLARIFLNQNHQLRYKDLKRNLLDYLVFSTDNQGLAETIKTQLSSQLNNLYRTYNEQPWNRHLLLRTCKRLIEAFTTVDQENPSLLFILLITQGEALTLAILLLKIVLLCPATSTHLECCLSQLIQYYKNHSETECAWLIHFLEVIQVTLTIYAEDVRYNLVNMSEYKPKAVASNEENAYRIFSQMKRDAKNYKRSA